MKIMKSTGIEALPPAFLQDIHTLGRLEAVDLASLDTTASVFCVPSGNEPDGFKSITEAAAHHYCGMHHVFESLPSRNFWRGARAIGSWFCTSWKACNARPGALLMPLLRIMFSRRWVCYILSL